MKYDKVWVGVALFGMFIFAMAGCGKNEPVHEKIIATVNGEPIYVKDLNRSIALNLKRDPLFRVTPNTLEEHVDILVDRVLLIQEARKRELDRTEKFINTIKTFWEQTLIRDIMEKEGNEIEKTVSVTDDEVRAYYDKLSHRRTVQSLKSTDKHQIVDLMKGSPEKIKWEETVGPISYGDVSSSMLSNAFDIPKGEMDVFKDGDEYCLFYVKDDSVVPVGDFDRIKDEIRAKIEGEKKEKVFKDWLNKVREGSHIDLDRDALKDERRKYE